MGRSNAPVPKPVFTQTRDRVDVYDFIEIIVALEPGAAANPFTDIRLEGHFAPEGFHPALVEGFCDSPDGSLFRIRHMPSRAGDHSYQLTLSIGTERHTFSGLVHRDSRRPARPDSSRS